MTERLAPRTNLPPEQEAIRAKCFHPLGAFVEFPIEDVESSITARFEKIVEVHANRIAVKTETRAATYGQLNEMANRFARALLQRQGPITQLVALLLEKDVAQIAAMLGAMKAGKFFLILDPTFPKARLVQMLQSSRAKWIVTNRRNASLAGDIAGDGCETLQWEALDDAVFVNNLAIPIAPKALAFINFTSGSTGEPKGLLQSHRVILHNIMLRTNLVHVCAHDRVSLLSSGTCNAITTSLLALLNGAGLYSLEVKNQSVARLARWFAEERITIGPMSSSLFRSLCETLKGNENFPDLRVIRLRSEAVYKSDVDLYKQYFPTACIFVTGLSSNETGPLADYLIDHDTELIDNAVPVGYAARGKEILLLSQDGEQVGFDEVGEIAVRSRYLSPGYLRNPRLARAKFKCDPTKNGRRIYLTGDMGVMLSSGCLSYKGRKDFRLKVRGYPVDIGEVEIALRNHPSIQDAVVVARSNRAGETALVAYFVADSKDGPNISELRNFLGRILPDYMIPAAFVRLANVPLNPQNKADRTSLPPPPETRPDLNVPFMAPRNDYEQKIAAIWAEVLGIDRVGIHDNFFDLGGHSLAATRVVTRVIDKFRLELPLQVLFDSPTAEKMAAVITENQNFGHKPGELRSSRFSHALPARPVESTDFMPFPKEELERSIPERFEKIARLYPDRIALKTSAEVVTYAQLNAMANRMAHAIVEQRGTEPEAIAILMENGPRLMAAMLAVLKAGKFFISLDLLSPKARLAGILEDSQAALIISDRHEYEALRDVTTASLFESGAIPVENAETNLDLSISSGSLAGVLYTSGSTGEPKGVIWAHRNLLHQTMLFANAYRLSVRDRLLLTTSGTGNALTIGFLALLNGAALLPLDTQNHGVEMLIRWIAEEKITICWMGSPLFRNMCRALPGKRVFPDVRILRLSSEASFKSDIELYKAHFSPECVLFNGLSNTEAGLVCLYPVDFETEIAGQDIPVGYPVEDKEVLLLDEAGKEVGFHEVGEIAIRSRYLAAGYWRRPELTAIKFRPDPRNGDQRTYLSGDLGIRLADGSLIHKGRKDFRVKIRGYGVELAEVEKVLASHASLRQVVVVAQNTNTGEARLVAYFTRTELPAPTISELRDFLKTRLPDFMIPSVFVMLERIPLTPSGKIDRRALPQPDNLRPDLATAYVAPRDDIEQKLVSIWEDVLDVRPIGVNDGFFHLGGNSLSATRVISQILEDFQVEISVRALFQSPSIADVAAVIARRQDELAENEQAIDATVASVAPISRESFLPLSYSQQRLWFIDRLDPGSFTYNLFSAYRLKGGLNIAALEQSFNEIVRRHEVLRTVFKSEGGKPIQVVLPHAAITVPLIDLRSPGLEQERWAKARRRFTQEAQRPFDLATGPLIRITLLQLADDEYVLLRTMHHIVSDGWSEGVLFHELSEIYNALSTGQPSPLSDLPAQYADYAKWQRQRLVGERLESRLSYWKKQLDNIATLHLPTDRPREALHGRPGGRRYFALSDELSASLKKLSRQHRATLFMILLAGYQTLLHRYSNQTDIVIGSPVAGRNSTEFDGLIGFFLDMLVLRLDLSGDPTFAETIARAREVCLGALSHQELPFEKLVEELHPDRNLGKNPLFQVSFAFQNTPRMPLRLGGLTVEELEVETGIARFDLHLFMEELDGHLKGYCDYDTNLFNADTIERMVGHFKILLEGIVANPEQRISELPLLNGAEKQAVLLEWNSTTTEYPKDQCIHELFEAQVRKSADAVAITFEDQQFTYQELNCRANQLAHYLRKVGVGPNVLVGICIERSLNMIVALLGILKAGGAYVPLDPSYPTARLEFMLKDTQAGIVLTDGVSRTRLPSIGNVQVICLDRDWHQVAGEPQDNPSNRSTAESLAYVVYTSGSTGVPKGVEVRHRGVVRLLFGVEYVQLDKTQTFLHLAPISFDAATFEIWGGLLHGGKCVLYPGRAPSSRELGEVLNQHRVTTVWLTAALFNTVIDEEPQVLSGVKQLLVGGESLSVPHVRKALAELPHTRIINGYGPTEGTTFTCCYRIPRQLHDNLSSIPIGKPIGNTQVYILDKQLHPVPIGVVGELHIGGDGLARDYLNRPELTNEKFIANPFNSGPDNRLYKTGDLGRYLADGNIEFVGRIDNQVKLRGYRVELGEVETVLGQHPAVRNSVVVVREDAAGDKRLIAYLVARPGESWNGAEIRKYLRQKLPDYMVPSAFVLLSELPLTPNGKVDRGALPAPERDTPELASVYQAPRTPVEETIASIWRKILKTPRVGIHDNFFDLGGHSLLATQVISRLRDVLKVDIPLRVLFELPTIAQIAGSPFLATPRQEYSEPDLVPHPRAPTRIKSAI